MLWDPILKKNLLNFVLADPINNARDPAKKTQMRKMPLLSLSKLTLNGFNLLLLFFKITWKKKKQKNKKQKTKTKT